MILSVEDVAPSLTFLVSPTLLVITSLWLYAWVISAILLQTLETVVVDVAGPPVCLLCAADVVVTVWLVLVWEMVTASLANTPYAAMVVADTAGVMPFFPA